MTDMTDTDWEFVEVRIALILGPRACSVPHVLEEMARLPWWERLMLHAWESLP